MCLANAYLKVGDKEEIICENVVNIDIEGQKIVLTDVLHREKIVVGQLQSVDITNSIIIISKKQ